jgi:hypothetical protein
MSRERRERRGGLTDFEKHTVQLLQKVIVEHFWLLRGKRGVADLMKKKPRLGYGNEKRTRLVTSREAWMSAFHSILGRKPRRKSGLKSASRRASFTSESLRGKLLVVQPLAWHARRLWVMSRTMAAGREEKKAKPDRDSDVRREVGRSV